MFRLHAEVADAVLSVDHFPVVDSSGQAFILGLHVEIPLVFSARQPYAVGGGDVGLTLLALRFPRRVLSTGIMSPCPRVSLYRAPESAVHVDQCRNKDSVRPLSLLSPA